jgi:hypothetical protein
MPYLDGGERGGYYNGLKPRLAESCDESHDPLPHIKRLPLVSAQTFFFSFTFCNTTLQLQFISLQARDKYIGYFTRDK